MELNEKGIQPLMFATGSIWLPSYTWFAWWVWHVAQPENQWWHFPMFMTLLTGLLLPLIVVAVLVTIAYCE